MKHTIMAHAQTLDTVETRRLGEAVWLSFSDPKGGSVEICFSGGIGLEAVGDVIAAHLRDGETHQATIRYVGAR